MTISRMKSVNPKYDEAVELVLETRQASMSMLQRRLRVSYYEAARLIELMEQEGIIGPADGVKPREVLCRSGHFCHAVPFEQLTNEFEESVKRAIEALHASIRSFHEMLRVSYSRGAGRAIEMMEQEGVLSHSHGLKLWKVLQGNHDAHDESSEEAVGEDHQEAIELVEELDPNYDDAVELVLETRQASISMLQRRLRVGYNRAARMIEMMERDGIVGPSDGVKPREVFGRKKDK